MHPLLAAATPLLFLLCMDAAARAVLHPLPFPTLAIQLMLAFTAMEAVAMGNLLRDERAGFFARLRELLAVLALTYALAATIASVKTRAFVTGGPDFAYPLLFVLLQWTLTVCVHAALRERELLLTAIMGKEGEELLHKLREASLQAGLALGGLRSLKILMIAFQIQLFATLLTLLALRTPIGAWAILLFGAHALYGAFAMGLINMYRENQILLGEGIVVPGRFEAARIRASLAVLAVCLPIVLLASRNESPLSLTLLSSLFDWMDRLIPRLAANGVVERMRQYLAIQRLTQARILSSMPAAELNPAAVIFFEFLRRLLASAAGTGLYFFLVSPLFSEEFLDSLARHGLLAFLRRKLKSFLRFWAEAFLQLVAWLRSLGERRWGDGALRSEARREYARRSRGRAPSLRKRLQMDRVLKAFLLLVQWGQRHGVEYKGSDTPQEYALRLAPRIPDGPRRLSMIVDVLEESVYSTHVLESGRMAGYFAAVRLIRKSA